MDLTFCPELEQLVETRRAVGESGRVFESLVALSTVNNLQVLRAMMLDRQPERTLEVGLSFGGSALVIAASHRDLGRTGRAQHVAIDPFQSTVWDNSGVGALQRAGLAAFVEVSPRYSANALAAYQEEGRRFDLIYVDGSHLFEDVFVDAYFGCRLLSETGVILFDDCANAHVAKVIGFLLSNSDWTAEVDLSSYRADGGSPRYQLAKRLGRTQLRAFRRTAAGPRAWDAPFRRF